MSYNESINVANKILRKQKRCQHIIEKETGILTYFTPKKNIVICNAGLSNGLTEENIFEAFNIYGSIERIILLPGKSCAFVCFSAVNSAEDCYININGKLNLGQDNKPLYLLYSETVPECAKYNDTFPPGLQLINDFVTEKEEDSLLSGIEWNINTNLKHRRVKHYGFEFRYDINNVDRNCPLEEKIPEECLNILQRYTKNVFQPDQLTINQYQPGQGIPPHVDTHSAFEEPILSLSLGSAVNMDFRHKDGRHFSLLLPRRSLLVMAGESRYAWTHGITPRKLDVIRTDQGLTVQNRGTRTSFTFRKVRSAECTCEYKDNCDSHAKRSGHIEEDLAEKLETAHVHKVYEEIASHFSDTRHKPWPNVLEFIHSLGLGAVLVDIGCGNGKYLGHNKSVFEIGCDRSFNLIDICNNRGFQVFTCNCLNVPLKADVADGVISIAVIHHLANEERRLQSIKEIVRVLRPGGRALIYVWAKDQKKQQKSSYLKQDRKNRKQDSATDDVHPSETISIGENAALPVHVNRTQFQFQDVLVPWKLKQTNAEESNLFLRYYHVFEEGELETLCGKINNVHIVKSYYDQGNWCVILQKNNI